MLALIGGVVTGMLRRSSRMLCGFSASPEFHSASVIGVPLRGMAAMVRRISPAKALIDSVPPTTFR